MCLAAAWPRVRLVLLTCCLGLVGSSVPRLRFVYLLVAGGCGRLVWVRDRGYSVAVRGVRGRLASCWCLIAGRFRCCASGAVGCRPPGRLLLYCGRLAAVVIVAPRWLGSHGATVIE